MKLSELKLSKNNKYVIKDIFVDSKIKNLKLIVSNCFQNDNFIAFADDDKINCFVKYLSKAGEIQVSFEIPTKSRKICLIGQCNNKNYKVFQLNINAFFKIKLICQNTYKKTEHSILVIKRGIKYLWREHHFLIPISLWKEYILRFKGRFTDKGEVFLNPYIQSDYLSWIKNAEHFEEYRELEYQPLLSVLIPVYNVSKELLSKCIESVLNQSYSNFEVCIADDCSNNKETLETLRYYEKKDNRIKVVHRTKNGHISRATNTALSMAKGEFVCLLDNDDELAPQALYENVLVLNKNRTLDFIYSDEDKLDLKGQRIEPHFKADFSPDTLLGINYITHFAVIRTEVVKQVGGFEVGLEGVQDHDLFLKIAEVTDKIYHIPKILYHWRMTAGSTSISTENKSYAVERGIKAVNNALQRRNVKGTVKSANDSTVYLVEYDYEKEPSVSIIIPIRDHADITEKCLSSIYKKTKYQNYEVIIVDNNSIEDKTFKMLSRYNQEYSNFRVIKADMEFNYSAINNFAVDNTDSDVLVLLNNDTEVLTNDWLKNMVSYATQKHIGAVGAKLLYPDMTIQHGGILIGVGGEIAQHAFITKPREDIGIYGRLLIPYNYSAVTAACLAVERKKYLAVKGLEEKLKVAFNDVDFCLKLLSCGYYNVLLPQVELIHYESKSRGMDTTSEKYQKFINESNYMQKKWNQYISNDPYYNINYSRKGAYLFDRFEKENSNEI